MNKLYSYGIIFALLAAGVQALSQTSQAATSSSTHQPRPSLIISDKPTNEVKSKTYKKNEQLSPKELKSILYEAGFRGKSLKIAWAVAMKESTGRPRSHNDNPKTGDNSYGLFQINMIDSLGPARREKFKLKSNKDLFDPLKNSRIAYFMSNKGKDWSSWSGITGRTAEFMSKFPD
jgi:hypothetical protein